MLVEKEFEIIMRIVPSQDNMTISDIIAKRDEIRHAGTIEHSGKIYPVVDMWIKEENPDLYKLIIQVDDANA